MEPEDFLHNKGICSDTTIGTEGDYLLTDLLKEYAEPALHIANVSGSLPFDIHKGIEICQRWEQHLSRTNTNDIADIREQEKVVKAALGIEQ